MQRMTDPRFNSLPGGRPTGELATFRDYLAAGTLPPGVAEYARPTPKPAAPKLDPRVAELRDLENERKRLKAALAKREREDAAIAELRRLRAEGARLRAELAHRNKRGVKFARGGFHVFGKHEQRTSAASTGQPPTSGTL